MCLAVDCFFGDDAILGYLRLAIAEAIVPQRFELTPLLHSFAGYIFVTRKHNKKKETLRDTREISDISEGSDTHTRSC